MVSLDPTASARKLQDDLTQVLTEFRKRHTIDASRDRQDKYREYLAVWDQREGWTNGGYDDPQKLLKDVAKQLRKRVSTIQYHYKSAFQLITGYEYTPELYSRFFGITQLCGLFKAPDKVALRRPLKSGSPVPVPESTLGPQDHSNSILDTIRSLQPDSELLERLDELIALFESEKTNAEIAEHYRNEGLDPPNVELARERLPELKALTSFI
ncbi:hypothetical protein [Stratiformator vulcanicus]|uniref:Uncharacterized protein n=1 Tax=Stratiformator vulcanicus TaxID=2527980 RepID=A0A517R126_9PLAN|nr:hypothetical protein [Stratiformator vulcanicus]QDT37597.1 hypothetical protein Pan189_19770 [Stratiformator vulcanicus]